MDSNCQIITAAISRYTFLPKSLKTLVDYTVEIATPAHVNFPSIEEMNDLILRGAEFKNSHHDHILLDNCTLHYQIVQQSKSVTLVYSCLCGPVLKGHLAQEFLQAVQTSISKHPKIRSFLANSRSDLYQFRAAMNPMLKELMMEANKKNIFANSTVIDLNNPQVEVQPLSKVSDLQKQVDEVKTVMSDNMIRILERGDRLENIDHRTEALHASSQNFKTTARRVQRNMWWKNLKWTIILGVFLAVLVTLIILFVLKQLGAFGSK